MQYVTLSPVKATALNHGLEHCLIHKLCRPAVLPAGVVQHSPLLSASILPRVAKRPTFISDQDETPTVEQKFFSIEWRPSEGVRSLMGAQFHLVWAQPQQATQPTWRPTTRHHTHFS